VTATPRPLSARLFADGLFTFGGQILNMLVAAALGVLTARVLGPHGRGIYALPMVASALASAAYAGLSSTASYFLLREKAGRAILPSLFASAALFFLAGAVVAAVAALAEHAAWAIAPAVLSLIGPLGLMMGLGYSTGTHRVRLNTTFTIYGTGLTFALMATAFAFIARAPIVAVYAWVCGSDLVSLALVTWIVLDARKLPLGEPVAFARFLTFAIKTGSVSLVSLLNYRADVYVVALMAPPAALGMYTVAVTAAETMLAVTKVTSVVATPHIGSLSEIESARLVSRCVRHNVLVAGICSGALALLAPFAVELLYGRAFLPMVPALRLLLIGVFVFSLGSPMSSYFTVRLGRPSVALVLASVSAAICIATAIALVPVLGLAGAAIASSLGYIISQSAAIVYFSRIAGISIADLLFPRSSDLSAYVHAARNLLRTS
jgi:O-antigen/teichoic acid export membrane protein